MVQLKLSKPPRDRVLGGHEKNDLHSCNGCKVLWASRVRRKTKDLYGAPYPQDLPGDVSYPVFFERVPFGVLHEVCDGPGPAELHHKLQGRQDTL